MTQADSPQTPTQREQAGSAGTAGHRANSRSRIPPLAAARSLAEWRVSAERVVWSLGRTSAAARSRASGLSNPGATGVGSAAFMPFRGFADPTAPLPDWNDATQQRQPLRKLTTCRRKFAG
jgi:hypothetical protein